MVIITTSQKDAQTITKVLKSHHDYDWTAPSSVSIYEAAIHAYLTSQEDAHAMQQLGHVDLSYDTMLHVPAYDQPEVCF